MSLLEAGRRRAQRRAKKPSPLPPEWSMRALDAPLAMSHPNQILTLHEWARLNRISVRTARRIIASGSGPIVTQLSSKRIGISIANNAAWQASRARG
jgi:hypothetical protein